MRLLMDTGASGEVTLHNLEMLGIDLNDIDLIFLSHGHYDHTGGLMDLLRRMKRRVPVIAHPEIFAPKLKARPFLKNIGLPFSRSQLEEHAVILLSKNPTTLAPGVITTGEVERKTAFEHVEGFWTIRDGIYQPDTIVDDQSLVLKLDDRGLVVISGCAHSGIINIIQQAKRLTCSDKICAVIGGFHLIDSDEVRINKTVEELLALDPEIVRPGHCTGAHAISMLQNALGERCKPLFTGEIVEL